MMWRCRRCWCQWIVADPDRLFFEIVGYACWPGLAPAGDLLFFASPKKPKEKKGDPMVWVLPLRSRQPAVLAESGAELELASLRQSLVLIHFRLRSSAQRDGWGEQIRTRGGGDPLCAYPPEPDPAPESVPAFIPHPSVCAEERRSRRIRDRDCLSRRRVRARPRLDRAPQVAP